MVNRTNWHNDHPVACTCANCQEKARIRNTSDRKIGRNEKCPCGSEKKYKDCHGKQGQKDPWKKIAIYVAIGIVLIWFAMDLFSFNKPSISSAPPGKVWSEEHGHWHDIPK